jgi:hypothetical protein
MSINLRANDGDGRSDPGLDDLFCGISEIISVSLVVALVNGRVESVGPVDLYVYQTRAEWSISAPC